jgi:Ca-activated chloride channel family protein
LKSILFLLAISSLIVAVARPQFGSKLKEVKRKGVEIVIALDVSNSMLARDIQPNRLERAKRAIAQMVDKMQNDKIGLIVFAGDAYVQVPITTDYTSTKMFLGTISPNIVPKQGTAIGSAIQLAMKSYDPASDLSKALIVITDGENHEGDAIEMAKAAAEKGITVHAIGMGSPTGSPIPVRGSTSNYLKDRQGNTIVSKLDEATLQQMAAIGNGAYIRASNAGTGLRALFKEINKMDKKEIESKAYSEYEDQFPYFIGLALILLAMEFLILERKNKWLKNMKLFGENNEY